jgi:hypothetical protein
VLRELLHRLLRLRDRGGSPAADFGPLPPRVDNDGWLVEPHGGGWLHRPLPGPVERGPAVDPFAPVPQLPRHPLRPSEVLRAAARQRRWHDATGS